MHFLDRLLEERASLTGVMTSLRDRAADEDRDLTATERTEIARHQERCVVIDGLLTEHQEQTSSARAFADLAAKIEQGRSEAPRTSPGRAPEQRSAGQMVVESTAFKSYPGRGQMPAVEVADYLGLEQRAVIMTTDLAIAPYIWANPVPEPPAPLLDIVNHVRVSSGVVEWVESGPAPAAGVVAEGQPKPEATLTFTPKSATLDTLAHWVQITRQALSDAPYMRSLIEGKLRRGLLRKIEADLGVLLEGATLQTAVNADLLSAIRIGVGMVEDAGYRPNAVVLNPADYAALDINAMTIATGPDRRSNFWGLTPIASASKVAGTAIVGDFKEGVTLFDRGVSDVFVTDSHAAFFISNILVILAEGRYKSAITDPLALAETAAA